MRSVLDSSSLGELRRVTSAFTFRAEGWDGSEFRLAPSLGGGCLLDLGWYCVGVSLWAFGQLPHAVRGHAIWRKDDVDVTFSGLMHFTGSGAASFDCGFETVMRKWVEIAGEFGSIVCDDFTRPWSPDKARFWTHDSSGKAAEHRSDPFIQEDCLVAAFCRLARSGPDHAWADRAVDIQRVCDALLRSARDDRTVDLA